MSRAHHTDIPFPHEGCCFQCRALEICNCCGQSAPKATRCTNGHCTRCHADVCTPGGITGPGHGFGSQGKREAAAFRIQQECAGSIHFDAWVHHADVVTMEQCAAALAHARSIIARLMSAPNQLLSTDEVMFLQDWTVAKSAIGRLAQRAVKS